MRIARVVGRRFIFLGPQLVGITLVTFLLVRLIPGNPAFLLAGPMAGEGTVEAYERELGLDKPIVVQYFLYVGQLAKGDLGFSWWTGNEVLTDIMKRVPATLELVTISMIIIVVLGVLTGIVVGLRSGGFVDRLGFVYGLFAGAFPDYWLALVLVFLFFFQLGLLPAPVGRLDLAVANPPQVTGFLLVDSVLAGDREAFVSASNHLLLPVITLVAVYMGAIVKMTRSTLQEKLDSDFITFAKASGLGTVTVVRYALRNALPPVLTIIGVTYAYLLGSAVLVETVFSWGGIGQYAVGAVLVSDYSAIQGFVLVAALFNLVIYLLVDIAHLAIDPRVSL